MIRMVSKQSSISHTVWPTHLNIKKKTSNATALVRFLQQLPHLSLKSSARPQRFSFWEGSRSLRLVACWLPCRPILLLPPTTAHLFTSAHIVCTPAHSCTHICIFDVITNMNSCTKIYLCIISGTKYCFACTLCRSTISVRHSKCYIETVFHSYS